jgi:hypothetical protein
VLSPPRLQRAAAATTEPCPLPLIPTTCVLSPVGLETLTAWYQQCQVLPLRHRYRPPSPPPPASAAGRLPASSVLSDVASPSGGAITLESLARSIADLTRSVADTNRNVAAMQSAWATLVQPPPPPHPHLPPAPLPTTGMLLAGLSSMPLSSTRARPPAGVPQQATAGVPLSRISWPASSSPIPSWVMGSLPADTAAPVPAPSPQRQPVQAGATGALHDGVAGPTFGPDSSTGPHFGGHDRRRQRRVCWSTR